MGELLSRDKEERVKEVDELGEEIPEQQIVNKDVFWNLDAFLEILNCLFVIGTHFVCYKKIAIKFLMV